VAAAAARRQPGPICLPVGGDEPVDEDAVEVCAARILDVGLHDAAEAGRLLFLCYEAVAAQVAFADQVIAAVIEESEPLRGLPPEVQDCLRRNLRHAGLVRAAEAWPGEAPDLLVTLAASLPALRAECIADPWFDLPQQDP
jgi:hypothetical protein